MNKHSNYFYLLLRLSLSVSHSQFHSLHDEYLNWNLISVRKQLCYSVVASHVPKLSELKCKCTVNIIRHVCECAHCVRTVQCSVFSWIIIVIHYKDIYPCSLFACVWYLLKCVFFCCCFFGSFCRHSARLHFILFGFVYFNFYTFCHCLWVNKRFIITVSISFDVCLLAQCSYLFPFCHFSHPMPFHFTIPFSFAFNFMILLWC